MAEFFGDLERLAADLYPYRWPITIGILIVLAAVILFGYRRGWHMIIWRRRLPVAIVGIPLLVLFGFVGYDLGSPLFVNKTVEEEFPFAFSAIVPEDMKMAEVEKIMEGMAKVTQEVNEPMPDSGEPTPTPKVSDTPAPTPTQLSSAISTPAISPAPTSNPAPFPTPETTQAEPTTGPVKLKTGNFRDQDSFHKGSGQATIYRGPDGSHLLRLEDFEVTNGPDLHIILSPHRDPKSQSDLKQPGYVDIGKLKGNIGNQNYSIPNSVDVAIQGSVVIYCKPFHVIFSVAPLQDLV